MVAELIAEGQVRLADGTLIACANYPGCASQSHMAGHASYGYCPSKSQFVWGMRLVLLATSKGCRSAMTSSAPRPARSARAPTSAPQAHAGSVLFADGGFWGAEYQRTMELIDGPARHSRQHKLGERPPAEVAKARIRLVIESVFSNLKRQMRLEDHLAKTLGGLAQRIAQRLLALTLGIYINLLAGRPARALVAYDGR